MKVEWKKEFDIKEFSGRDAAGNEKVDLVKDLLSVDIGKLYRDLEQKKEFGLIPLMANGTHCNIGANMSESFCERVISQYNLVLDKGNALLSAELLEMIIILRMNRDFMIFMRREYPDVANQLFKQTVVRREEVKKKAPKLAQDVVRYGKPKGAKNKTKKSMTHGLRNNLKGG